MTSPNGKRAPLPYRVRTGPLSKGLEIPPSFTNHPGKKPVDVIKIDSHAQVLWPPHCVQGMENARILVDNNLFLATVQKGRDERYNSYSGFQDDGGQKT